MTTPALQRFRERFPETQITMLGPRYLADLWLHHPSVDAQLTFERGEKPWSIARRLRPQNYDLALVLPNSPRAALEVWLSRIPQRVGYARPWRSWFLSHAVPSGERRVLMHKKTAREVRMLIKQQGSGMSTLQKPAKNSSAHQIHDYLQLVSHLGANSVPLAPALHTLPQETDAAIKSWTARIDAAFPGGSQTADPLWLGLSPSSAYGPAKCWPTERFAATAQAIAGRFNNAVWLVFGTAKERAECERVVQLAKGRILNVAGQTSLRELMVMLKLCRVVLTNDSGPMHVAAALGTPVVVPFGSTAPELTGPGLPGNTRNLLLQAGASCSPCFRRTCPVDFRCMTGIGVDQAVAAILKTLEH